MTLRLPLSDQASSRRPGSAALRGLTAIGLVASSLAGATAAVLAVASSAQAAPAPVSPTVVWLEDFENFPQPAGGPSGTTPMALNYTGQGTYVGASGNTYTGSVPWLDVVRCNGIVIPGTWAAAPWPPTGTQCAGGAMADLIRMIRVLGTLNGRGNANHAVAAYTNNNPGAGVLAQTSTAVPLSPSLGTGHYISMSVNAAAISCGQGPSLGAGDPVLTFEYSTDGGSSWKFLGGDVKVCKLPTIASGMKGGAVFSNAGSLQPILSSTVLVRVSNKTGIGWGNDMAWDDLKIYDSTPTLTKTFSPDTVESGGVTTLTFTITNTTEKGEKAGWSFSDTLPAGLQVDTVPDTKTTCAAATVAGAGTGVLTVTGGTIAAGVESCTVSVRIKVEDPAKPSYENVLDGNGNVSAMGLIPSGRATLTTLATPTLTKAFSPTAIEPGDVSTLTFTVSDAGGLAAFPRKFSFAETLPSGLTVAANPNAGTDCASGTVTADADGTGIEITGGTVAGGATCTIHVDVTGAKPGDFVNDLGTGGNLTSSAGLKPGGTATLTVKAPPTPVTAVDDAESTVPGKAVTSSVTGNDSVPAGSTYALATGPSHGTVVVNPDGTYTYTPAPGFEGVDEFTYQVCAPAGTPCSTAKVSITVASAANDRKSTQVDTPVSGSAATNDKVPAGSVYSVTTQPTHGTVVMQPNGSYVYTPAPGYKGTDEFTYQVCVPGGLCQTATVTITVTEPPASQGGGNPSTDPGTNPGTDAGSNSGTNPGTGSSTGTTDKPVQSGSTTPVNFIPPAVTTPTSITIAKPGTQAWTNEIIVPGKGAWKVQGNRAVFRPSRGFAGTSTIRYNAVAEDGHRVFGTFTARATVVPSTINGGWAG